MASAITIGIRKLFTMSNLEHAKEVQLEVFKLIAGGADVNSVEGRKAMNRLINTIRLLTPSELQEFQEWKQEEQSKS